MTDLATHEFVALRDTIRSRGGARPLAFLAGVGSWALALVLVLAWLPNPIASVVPLALLLATFEVVRTLHLGVERIGRYLQVFFEEDTGGSAATSAPAGAGSTHGRPLTAPAWERTAMAFGPAVPGAGGHPLFVPVVLIAVLINFLAVWLPGPLLIELATLAVPHVAMVLWVLHCDRGMRKQRAAELARFRELREELARPRSH